MQASGTLYIVAAPSGAGKTSLIRALLESTDQIEVSISHTTRAPRPGEREGIDYFFTDQEHFLELIRQETFLEHARVFDHYYGTSRESVLDRLQQGNDVILEIDWQGARQVRAHIPQVCSIFILPASREVLRQRLENRAQDSAEIIERRMRDAVNEISHYQEFDYLIVNEYFASALENLRAIVLAQRQSRERQQLRHADLLHKLLS